MNEGVNQGRNLALDDEVAGRLEVGDDLSKASAELTRDQDDMCMLLVLCTMGSICYRPA